METGKRSAETGDRRPETGKGKAAETGERAVLASRTFLETGKKETETRIKNRALRKRVDAELRSFRFVSVAP
jgi:hypothetical protein